MIKRHTEVDPITVNEVKGTKEVCLANVDDKGGYVSCGETLRRRRNGVTYCPTHGEMH